MCDIQTGDVICFFKGHTCFYTKNAPGIKQFKCFVVVYIKHSI